jgi:CRP-like cAMP-binding protein
MAVANDDTERVLAELARLPIGEAVGREHLRAMAGIGVLRDHAPGEQLFRQGEPARELSVVVSGRVSLTVDMPGKSEVLVATLSRGDLLGWSALLGWSNESTWSASAVASKHSTCLSFPGAALRELCERDHELGFFVMRHAFEQVAKRLRDCRVQLLDVYGDGR